MLTRRWIGYPVTTPLSLVVTDIHMPGSMDGLGLAQEIWRRWPTLPVILTLGDAVIDTGLLPARTAFIPKPWQRSDLALLINKLVWCFASNTHILV